MFFAVYMSPRLWNTVIMAWSKIVRMLSCTFQFRILDNDEMVRSMIEFSRLAAQVGVDPELITNRSEEFLGYYRVLSSLNIGES